MGRLVGRPAKFSRMEVMWGSCGRAEVDPGWIDYNTLLVFGVRHPGDQERHGEIYPKPCPPSHGDTWQLPFLSLGISGLGHYVLVVRGVPLQDPIVVFLQSQARL